MKNLDKYYNHDKRHYRFDRTCADFEPDANSGDRFVIGVSIAIAFGLAFWSLIAYFLG